MQVNCKDCNTPFEIPDGTTFTIEPQCADKSLCLKRFEWGKRKLNRKLNAYTLIKEHYAN